MNQSNSTWSSFDRELAEREGTVARRVEVPAVTLADLLQQYGIPHYLKIDIEGMDVECLASLDAKHLPHYISLELGHGDGIIKRLHELGYSRFKVINQGTYTTATPIFQRDIGWRILRKLRAGRWVPDGVKQDFDRFARDGWRFNEGCSGPFGEETFGPWRPAAAALQLHERIQRKFVRGGIPLAHCWYDVHATV